MGCSIGQEEKCKQFGCQWMKSYGEPCEKSDEDYDELIKFKWHISPDLKYARRSNKLKGKNINVRMHRFIMKVEDPKIFIDHVNGDGLDNRKSNLRLCTPMQNSQNVKSKKNSTSKYLGVSFCNRDKRWRASICVNKKRMYIGMYDIEEDAARAYDKKASFYFKEFANLNFK